jgi:hypothetical protein
MAEEMRKTGIEMLHDLYEQVATFDRRLQNVEHLLKEVLDAARKSPPQAASELPRGLMVNCRPAQAAGQAAPPAQGPKIESRDPEPPAITPAANAKVIGKIRHDGKGLPEVIVTIYDSKNHAVKRTKTNRSGHWMAFLPPGKYAAECVLDGKINGNAVFTVQPGDSAVSVGQPQ